MYVHTCTTSARHQCVPPVQQTSVPHEHRCALACHMLAVIVADTLATWRASDWQAGVHGEAFDVLPPACAVWRQGCRPAGGACCPGLCVRRWSGGAFCLHPQPQTLCPTIYAVYIYIAKDMDMDTDIKIDADIDARRAGSHGRAVRTVPFFVRRIGWHAARSSV